MEQFRVIITEDKVYATHNKTICAREYFGGDVTLDQDITNCKAVAFSYASTAFGPISCKVLDWQEKHVVDKDIFNYLEDEKEK